MEDLILLVDDEPCVVAALQRALSDEPFVIHKAHSGEEGLEAMLAQRFKVVISDERMPGMGGAEFLSLVRDRCPATVRIMLTGHASIESTMKAVNSGEIYRFFVKPWDNFEMKLALRSAIEKYDLEAENQRLLRIVTHQARELTTLEREYPGITRLKKDGMGNLIVPDTPEADISRLMDECGKKYR